MATSNELQKTLSHLLATPAVLMHLADRHLEHSCPVLAHQASYDYQKPYD